ncbi:hypothetical protein [Shewanella sp.]|uniref:hypothetical protein n=1 Tax=Shewanella sp. TaxID=50422 RepID=UPI003A96E642
MNLDKAKKRIAKLVSRGFKGYPLVSIAYLGATPALATKVVISFVAEEGAEPQLQTFSAATDVRHDENIQTVIVKIIERTDAQTVNESTHVAPLTSA